MKTRLKLLSTKTIGPFHPSEWIKPKFVMTQVMKNATDDDWMECPRCQSDRGVPKGPDYMYIYTNKVWCPTITQ